MNFGKAIEQLKQGKKIKRAGWGGYWFIANESIEGEVIPLALNGMIIAKLKDGGYAPGTAYQADILAEDWDVVE